MTISEAISKLCEFITLANIPLPENRLHSNNNPRDAVLVIDKSPSMRSNDWKPSRLKAAQQAAHAYVERLRQEDPTARVAIVAYGRKARVMCGLTLVSNVKKLRRAIDGIRTCVRTNITAGVETAYALLKFETGTCQVILLTDGEHNTGEEPYDIATRLREIATLETIGIGGTPSDVNEDLLKDISSSYPDGSKRYHWIGDEERLVKEFDELAGRLARA